MKRQTQGGLVYSTDGGRMCPACRRPVPDCACKRANATGAPPSAVRVSLETKGRGGKCVTVVKGLSGDAMALAQILKQLKTACGSGGTVKDGVLEIQGDHREQVSRALSLPKK